MRWRPSAPSGSRSPASGSGSRRGLSSPSSTSAMGRRGDRVPVHLEARPTAGRVRRRTARVENRQPLKAQGAHMSDDQTSTSDDAVIAAASDGTYTLVVADFADTEVAWEAYEML